MIAQKAMATVSHALKTMAKSTLQVQTYHKSRCLSSQTVLKQSGG